MLTLCDLVHRQSTQTEVHDYKGSVQSLLTDGASLLEDCPEDERPQLVEQFKGQCEFIVLSRSDQQIHPIIKKSAGSTSFSGLMVYC